MKSYLLTKPIALTIVYVKIYVHIKYFTFFLITPDAQNVSWKYHRKITVKEMTKIAHLNQNII